jgi:hypothetical protein
LACSPDKRICRLWREDYQAAGIAVDPLLTEVSATPGCGAERRLRASILPIFLANSMCKDHPAIRIVRSSKQALRDRLCP